MTVCATAVCRDDSNASAQTVVDNNILIFMQVIPGRLDATGAGPKNQARSSLEFSRGLMMCMSELIAEQKELCSTLPFAISIQLFVSSRGREARTSVRGSRVFEEQRNQGRVRERGEGDGAKKMCPFARRRILVGCRDKLLDARNAIRSSHPAMGCGVASHKARELVNAHESPRKARRFGDERGSWSSMHAADHRAQR